MKRPAPQSKKTSPGRTIPYDAPTNSTPGTEKDLTVYPNPASTILYLKLAMEIPDKAELEFYGILGNLVMSLPVTKTNNEYMVSIGSLPAGVYFCRLNQVNFKSKGQKLIILR